MLAYQNVPGFLHGAEPAYRWFLDHLPLHRPITWVEVGVLEGQTCLWLADQILTRDLPITLHAVDHFQGYAGIAPGLKERFDANTAEMQEAMGSRFVVHELSSTDAAKDFPISSVDVVWLDADHSYKAAREDILAWYPTLRYGGYLGDNAGHFPDVREAFVITRMAFKVMPRQDGSSWILVVKQ